MSQILTSIKNIPCISHFIIWIISNIYHIYYTIYGRIKKNFLDINILLIAYSAILIIPFCNSLLNIIKGEKIKTYLYQLVVFIFYIINTSTYGSLNYLHPIKGDIVSSIFHILFIIISILLFIIVFGITANSQNVKHFFDAKLKNNEE